MHRVYAIEPLQLKNATHLKTSSGIRIAVFYFCKIVHNVYYSVKWNFKCSTTNNPSTIIF